MIISLFLAGLYHGVHHKMMLFINATHFLSIRFYTCQETLLLNFGSSPVRWCTPGVSATPEAEAGGSLEPKELSAVVSNAEQVSALNWASVW